MPTMGQTVSGVAVPDAEAGASVAAASVTPALQPEVASTTRKKSEDEPADDEQHAPSFDGDTNDDVRR